MNFAIENILHAAMSSKMVCDREAAGMLAVATISMYMRMCR